MLSDDKAYCFIEFATQDEKSCQVVKIKLLRNAPKREEQFIMCCIGLVKKDLLYMKYAYGNEENSAERCIGTSYKYENNVKNLETGGICNRKIYSGLIKGFDANTDFEIFVDFKDNPTNMIMKRCFAEIVDGLQWLKDVGMKEKYLLIKDAGLCWKF